MICKIFLRVYNIDILINNYMNSERHPRITSEMGNEAAGEISRSKKTVPELKALPIKKESKTDFIKRDAKELAELLAAFAKVSGEKHSVMEAETLFKELQERARSKEYADKDAVERNTGFVLDTDQTVIIKFNDLGEEKTAKFSLTVNTDRLDKNYGHYDLVPKYGDANAARAAGWRNELAN